MKRNTFIKSCAAAFGVGVTGVKASENDTLDLEKMDKDALYSLYKSDYLSALKKPTFIHFLRDSSENKVAVLNSPAYAFTTNYNQSWYAENWNDIFKNILATEKVAINEEVKHLESFLEVFNKYSDFTLSKTGKSQFTLSRKILE